MPGTVDAAATPPVALPPLFMWAGGKRRLLTKYAPFFPDLAKVDAYVEPFLGGGAVFAYVAAQRPELPAVLGELNDEVASVYRAVKERPQELLEALLPYESMWAKLATPTARKPYYYTLRKKYWSLPQGDVATTALLYFLMKTGFNGIWQTCVASGGRFGTPAGLANQKGPVVSTDLVQRWSKALANTDVLTQSYERTQVPHRSFVYCDPPYRDSFTTYSTGFNDADQIALIKWCRETALSHKSLAWLANRDAGDGFFETHAADAVCQKIPVVYTAGRRKRTAGGFEAKPAVELLLMWDGRQPTSTG